MKHVICFLLCAAVLAACGADGLPTRPEPKADKVEDVDTTDVAVSVS